MDTEGHTVVVDGGATRTRLRLHDAAGAVLGEAEAGPSSLTLGVEQAWDSVEQGVSAACAAADLGEPRALGLRLVAGFAGGRSPTNRAAFREGDRLGCRDIVIVTDGYASLVGALGGGPGLVLAVGTGVTAYALAHDGVVLQSSGWGFPAGDEGGGAWIGHRALQAYLKKLDGRLIAESSMFDRITAVTGGDFDAIQAWLARARSTQYASLTPAVTEAAREGDLLAEDILAAATDELVETISAVDVLGSRDPIALLGGLAETFAPRFPWRIRHRTVAPRGSALDGLWLIAKGAAAARGHE